MSRLVGNYSVTLKFGNEVVQLNPMTSEKFVITQDMNSLLPRLDLRFKDPTGMLTHTIPFDKAMSRIRVEINNKDGEDVVNSFDFVVYRRMPQAAFGTSAYYDVSALLDVGKPFAPSYCRSFNQSIKTTLGEIAQDELGCDRMEIENSLNYVKHLVQPSWNNVTFFNWLKANLVGRSGEYGYKIFIRMKDNYRNFTVSSIYNMFYGDPLYKFVVSDDPYKDRLPIYDYEAYDNYKYFGAFGSKAQNYGYFDYMNSGFVENDLSIDDFMSLTRYHMIDQEDSEDSASVNIEGRTNEFTSDFEGPMMNRYFGRMSGLSKMWVLIGGLENISPGDMVSIFFPQGVKATANVFSYQYNGNWLTERVVHDFGRTFKTRLLLTRNGFDTDQDTTLVPAVKRNKTK